MKSIVTTMAAISALALAAPAIAQSSYAGQQNSYSGTNADANLSTRIGQLQMRLQAGVQSGSISRQEAVPLRQQLRQLTQLERQYALGGISGQERGELQRRIRDLRQGIRRADGNNQARWDQYDRQDSYGHYEGYQSNAGGYAVGDRIDNNRDGYDDRDYDRDGRWDDDYANSGNGNDGYGNAGQYQTQSQPTRGGIGGVIETLLGGGGRSGQQAPSGLYGLPDQYRDQYRDSSNAYYRTDGRQIYQIDARTRTVVRAFPMTR
jgi:hypothetical protein